MNLTFAQFKKIAQNYNLIPVYDSLPADLDTPVSALIKLKTDEYDFLFESVVGGEKWARYSFLGTQPKKIFKFINQKFEIYEPAKGANIIESKESPLEVLKNELSQYTVYEDSDLPRFFGGLVGYLGYDMVHYFDHIQLDNPKDKDLADMVFVLTDTVVIFDNLKQVMNIVNAVIVEAADKKDEARLKDLYNRAKSKIEAVKTRLKSHVERPSAVKVASDVKIEASHTKEEFCQIVKKAQDYIGAGDIFQVVLSMRFDVQLKQASPLQIYRAIRRINPSPYMYYLCLNDVAVVGASPEVLVRLEDKNIEVRPIAGTRKRGKTAERDLELETELKNDPKEKAEHIMLVDLGRNDIGRVAKTGSVHVDEQNVIEKYSHVMHLVSHVLGILDDGKDVFDVLKATFPAGTLSGAPKIRAMEIIEELETSARGVYGGAIGYISFTRNTDMAIAIRTAVIQKDKVTVQAGAGIVYNSVPELEYKECQNKAGAVLEAILGDSGLGSRD